MSLLPEPAVAAAALTGWSVSLVGGFALARDGVPVRLPPSARRVLAFLALHGRPALRSYVAGRLWPELPEEQGGASLRTALWRVRRECADLLDTRGEQLEIATGTGVDLRAARGLADRLLHPHGEPEPRPDTSALLHDLLPDWTDEWVLLERERFRQLRLHALEALCRDLTAAGDFAAAIDAGEAAVDGEPLRESAQRALIEAHLAERNRSEALRQYRRYRDVLREELDVAPSADLDALLGSHGLAVAGR